MANQDSFPEASDPFGRKRGKKAVLSEYDDPDVARAHRELREKAKIKQKADKAKAREQEETYHPREKRSFGYVMKQWWFGMSKESKRISWPTPKALVTSFLIVVLIVAVLTAVFFGITEIFVAAGILNS